MINFSKFKPRAEKAWTGVGSEVVVFNSQLHFLGLGLTDEGDSRYVTYLRNLEVGLGSRRPMAFFGTDRMIHVCAFAIWPVLPINADTAFHGSFPY